MNTLIIYDADPDGFGCAYAAWRALGDQGSKVNFHQVLHGEPLPEIAYEYDKVIIGDLSFPYNDMLTLSQAVELVVIDHHPSSQKDIEDLGLNPFPYDTTRAACVQMWDYFFPAIDPPSLLQYVADRDTWTWALEDSDEINSIIFLTPKTFRDWADLDAALEFDEYHVIAAGKAVVQYREALVNWAVEGHDLVDGWGIGLHGSKNIPIVATPVLHSEVGHRLLEMYPNAPFSVTYTDKGGVEGYRKFSLRSEDHREDVGAFAKLHGGGGHHNAAGFNVPIREVWKNGAAAYISTT